MKSIKDEIDETWINQLKNLVIQGAGDMLRVSILEKADYIWKSLKVLVPIHSLIPPIFFKHIEILVPEVESYLEDCMCEVSCANSL